MDKHDHLTESERRLLDDIDRLFDDTPKAKAAKKALEDVKKVSKKTQPKGAVDDPEAD